MPSPPDLALQVELIESAEGLETLRSAWTRLLAKDSNATPFQSPDWLIPWWRHVGRGRLLTLALHDDRGLAGLLPMYVYREGETRKLFPLGIASSDYLDLICRPGCEHAVARALFDRLAALRDRFHVMECPQLRASSPLLSARAPAGLLDRIGPGESCLALRLPDSFDALRAQVSAKTLRDLRTVRRRAAEAGAIWEDARADTLDELLQALFRLHAARWHSRGEAGVLAAAEVQAAHRDAAPALLRSGLLRMLALRLQGEIIAVLYGLADPPGHPARRLYLYIAGFDPQHERLSPGMLLVGEAIERAIAEGLSVADFLRGTERYKSFWGAQPEPTFRRVLTPCARS